MKPYDDDFGIEAGAGRNGAATMALNRIGILMVRLRFVVDRTRLRRRVRFSCFGIGGGRFRRWIAAG